VIIRDEWLSLIKWRLAMSYAQVLTISETFNSYLLPLVEN